MRNKLIYLESLRGIAALTVALLHFRPHSFINSNRFVINGEAMVDFFFVLSGFVIASAYLGRIKNLNDILSFQFRRFLRLYPIHFMCLMGFLVIEIMKYVYEQRTGVVSTSPSFQENDFSAFFNNLFLTQALFESYLSFNFPSWSISTLFYTYLLFGIIVLLIQNTRFRALIFVAIIIASGTMLSLKGSVRPTTGLALVRCFYSFFLGVIFFQLYKPLSIKVPGWMAMFVFGLVAWSVSFPEILPIIFLPFLFGSLILVLGLSGENLLIKLLSAPPLVYLGTISYGIYMIHAGVWWIFRQVIRFAFNLDDSLTLDPIMSTVLVLGEVLLTIVLAAISYKIIEMPVNNLRKKI